MTAWFVFHSVDMRVRSQPLSLPPREGQIISMNWICVSYKLKVLLRHANTVSGINAPMGSTKATRLMTIM